MNEPLAHAERSARRWGGTPEDYLPIHEWLDATRAHVPDERHRRVLHNSFGIALAEQAFGPELVNAAGRAVRVADVARQHVRDELGVVPTLAESLQDLPIRTPRPDRRTGLAGAVVSGTEPEFAHLAAARREPAAAPAETTPEETSA